MTNPKSKPRRKIFTLFTLWILLLALLLAFGVCVLVIGLTGDPFATLSTIIL